MEFIVKSDYDGYFEELSKSIIEKVENPQIRRVIVTAGPYRNVAVEVKKLNDGMSIHLDWYSALRTGFGVFSKDDETQLIQYINELKL